MAVSIDSTPGAVAFSNNPVRYRLQASGHQGLDNYRIEVVVKVGGITSEALWVQPNNIGAVFLDVSDVVRSLISNDILAPTLDADSPYVSSPGLITSITVTEVYGAPPVAQPAITSTDTAIVNGGVDSFLYAGLQYWPDLAQQKAFAQWWPNNRRVSRDMPNFLSLFAKDGNMTGNVVVEAFDDLAQLVTITQPVRTLYAKTVGSVLTFQVGPAQLSLPATVAYYRVKVAYSVDLAGTITTGATLTKQPFYPVFNPVCASLLATAGDVK